LPAAEIGALSTAAERDQALEIVLSAPIGELERLARRYFSPSALRRRRLAGHLSTPARKARWRRPQRPAASFKPRDVLIRTLGG
jgi:hypothetical protein